MKKRWMILGCALALGLGLVACDNGETTPEDGGTTPDDGGTEPAAVVGKGDDLDALSAADYSCLGMNTAPTSGADVTFTARVEDFLADMPVEGLTVQFFPNNMPSLDGSCAAPCVEVTSSADGTVSLTAGEGGWFGYRVAAGEGQLLGAPIDYVEAVQNNVVVPAAGMRENLIAVKARDRETIINLLSVRSEEGTATLTGTVTDCVGDPVANVDIRVFDSAGEVDLGFDADGPREFYFNGDSFPRAAQRLSHVDGLYGTANVPIPADNVVRIEAWGATEEGGEARLLACETTQAIADGITIINIEPLRADAPAGCGTE